jgi:dUTP pyrophosphatase
MTQTKTLTVQIKPLEHYSDLPLPAYETLHAAGMDLRFAGPESVTLKPMERKALPTGIAIALPEGYEAQVRPRSGLAIKKGLGHVNGPGTIDADYRGEIHVLAINLGDAPIEIERGMRIAQMLVAPVVRVAWEVRETLDSTQRDAGGFGHTGTS